MGSTIAIDPIAQRLARGRSLTLNGGSSPACPGDRALGEGWREGGDEDSDEACRLRPLLVNCLFTPQISDFRCLRQPQYLICRVQHPFIAVAWLIPPRKLPSQFCFMARNLNIPHSNCHLSQKNVSFCLLQFVLTLLCN